MKAEDKRIAIAKACGWTECEMYQPPVNMDCDPPFEPKAFPRGILNGGCWQELPNYPQDLNAMHEAEKTLNEKQQIAYVHCLWSIITPKRNATWDAMHTTAEQRAEAFWKVINDRTTQSAQCNAHSG